MNELAKTVQRLWWCQRLTPERQAQVAAEARALAAEGRSLDDACPYPWGTPAATHFRAVFLLAGGRP